MKNMVQNIDKFIGVLPIFLFILVESTFGEENICYSRDLNNTPKEIVISTWNIGHFSNGKKPKSLIDSGQYKSKLKSFRTMIYDSISADIIGINEFSPVFGKNRKGKEALTSDVLFDKFAVKEEGVESWVCNSIFSNIKLRNIKRVYFECSKPFISKDPRVALFNYVSVDALWGCNSVKIVLVHLVSRSPNLCQLQIEELLSKYRNYDKVIMLGDWNTWDWSKIKKEGYTLANDGSFITFPSKKYALDNIIVKGLKIIDVRVIETDLSDHYPLVCKIIIE